jgi:hypothetical protein
MITKFSTSNIEYLDSIKWETVLADSNSRNAAIDIYNGYCVDAVLAFKPDNSYYLTNWDPKSVKLATAKTVNAIMWSSKE